MNIQKVFEDFAADFERTVEDDNWSRLEKYFADDATYQNVGCSQPKYIGRKAILDFLRDDVANSDRRFDTRSLIALTPPAVDGNRLSRKWRATYTLEGAQELVIEGEARYLIEEDLIQEVEQELTSDSMRNLEQWMQENGERLSAE